jgi:hypothetical protein
VKQTERDRGPDRRQEIIEWLVKNATSPEYDAYIGEIAEVVFGEATPKNNSKVSGSISTYRKKFPGEIHYGHHAGWYWANVKPHWKYPVMEQRKSTIPEQLAASKAKRSISKI